MHSQGRTLDVERVSRTPSIDSDLLSEPDERALLQELTACKRKLSEALAAISGNEAPAAGDDPQAMAQFISTAYVGDGPNEARLGAIHHRYAELRGKLAMANIRLVAHVAKRFRDRGIPYADLLQEGFCGLLEAIDRFDTTHKTKLATYATWWIRQSMQEAVASGAYPVRLTPRHLRLLAQNQEQLEPPRREDSDSAAAETATTRMVQRIHSATRPAVSLDASVSHGARFSLLESLSDDDGRFTSDTPEIHAELDGDIEDLLKTLRPREKQVLALRFGLGGGDSLSLSQVGKVLEVSKERVRQIQERAMQKLRPLANAPPQSSE